MRIHTSDKIMAYLALLSGLTISAVAIYYSVAGLVAIFAAAVVPIMVMGVVLEISKLVATVWLKLNWNRAPFFIKTYLLSAITVLMLITSMGIFGFLSKAHSDQSLVSGDVVAKIAIIDEKIKIERENIANSQAVIKQMDAAVNGVISTGDQEVKLRDGSTRVNSAAERSLQIRRSQAKDRAKLTKEIEDAQARIVKMQEEAAPIRAEVRKVEAEVGPIKYIAALIYGDNPDSNLLERAVRWVIIIIVAVFDPLAVILLLSSQYSFQWFREEKDRELEDYMEEHLRDVEDSINDVFADELAKAEPEIDIEEPIIEKSVNDFAPQEFIPEEPFEPIKVSQEIPKEPELELDEQDDDEFDDESVSPELKAAMAAWKHDHPNDSLKRQRRLHQRGMISELPWEIYLKPQPDFTDIDAIEAARWAQEQLEKKTEEIAWMENVDGHQVKMTKEVDGYQQNAEQSDNTLWNRVKKSKDTDA